MKFKRRHNLFGFGKRETYHSRVVRSGSSSSGGSSRRGGSGATSYMGAKIYHVSEPFEGYTTSIDRDSIHDSLADAKAFIKSWKKNPAQFDRCVADVKKSLKKYGREGNAYAICRASGIKANLKRRRNVLPLDITTAYLMPGTFSTIDKERKILGRKFGGKGKRNSPSTLKAAGYHLVERFSNKSEAEELAREYVPSRIVYQGPLGRAAKWEVWTKKNPAGESYLWQQRGTRAANSGKYANVDEAWRDYYRDSYIGRVPEKTMEDARRAFERGWDRGGRRGKRNPRNPVPAAQQVYEGLHGHPSEELVSVKTDVHYHSVTAGIGDLRKMVILTPDGKYRVTLRFSKPYPILSTNEARTQLFIDGGDQSVNLREFGIEDAHESEVLGTLRDIYYFTSKDHLGPEDGGTAVYKHKFGSKEHLIFGKKKTPRPTVVYDVPNRLLSIAGGGYSIPDEGIDG